MQPEIITKELYGGKGWWGGVDSGNDTFLK